MYLYGYCVFQFAPPSFAHPQNNANSLSQFPPMSQMQAPVAPGPGQPWLSSGSQSASAVTPVQQVGQQSSVAASSDTVSTQLIFCSISFESTKSYLVIPSFDVI